MNDNGLKVENYAGSTAVSFFNRPSLESLTNAPQGEQEQDLDVAHFRIFVRNGSNWPLFDNIKYFKSKAALPIFAEALAAEFKQQNPGLARRISNEGKEFTPGEAFKEALLTKAGEVQKKAGDTHLKSVADKAIAEIKEGQQIGRFALELLVSCAAVRRGDLRKFGQAVFSNFTIFNPLAAEESNRASELTRSRPVVKTRTLGVGVWDKVETAGNTFKIAGVEIPVGEDYPDPKLVVAVAIAESGLNPNARSDKSAIGLMQLMSDTASDLEVNRRNPKENVKGGARYLKILQDKFNNKLELVLAAYNWGPNRLEDKININNIDISKKALGKKNFWENFQQQVRIPKETRDYVRRVLGNLSTLKQKLGDKGITYRESSEIKIQRDSGEGSGSSSLVKQQVENGRFEFDMVVYLRPQDVVKNIDLEAIKGFLEYNPKQEKGCDSRQVKGMEWVRLTVAGECHKYGSSELSWHADTIKFSREIDGVNVRVDVYDTVKINQESRPFELKVERRETQRISVINIPTISTNTRAHGLYVVVRAGRSAGAVNLLERINCFVADGAICSSAR